MSKPFLILLLFISFINAFSKTVLVNSSDGAAKLQEAVNSIKSGDSVLLNSGKYYIGDLTEWGLVLKDSIYIGNYSKSDSCILTSHSSDGKKHAKHILTIMTNNSKSKNLIIEGLTISEGMADGQVNPFGSAIFCYNSGLILRSCVLQNNQSDSLGGAFVAFNSKIEVFDSKFLNNKSINGGAIFVHNSSLSLNNVLCEYNDAFSAGALFLSSSEFSIINSKFRNNKGDSIAGAVFVYNSNNGIIDNSEFSNNRSINGGAICYYSSGSKLKNSVICDNYARGGGGLFLTTHSYPSIDNCKIFNNSAYEGGGIFVDSCETNCKIENCEIYNNSAIGYAGGVFLSNSINSLLFNKFHDNNSQDGAAIFTFNSSLTTKYNRFNNNISVGYGGALYIYGESIVDMFGDLIFHNKCSYGAGIYFEYHSKFIAHNCAFVSNFARIGGAFCTVEMSKPRFDSCLFVDNASYENYKTGLASIVVNSDSVSIINSNCYNNTLPSEADIINDSKIPISLMNNYWGTSDSTSISKLILGKRNLPDFSNTFIHNVPGDPIRIDSITFYSLYRERKDIISKLPDTILVRVKGKDRNSQFCDAACMIVRSDIYPSGISFALAETDTASGTYEGTLYISSDEGKNEIFEDDAFQIIKVNPKSDNIIIESCFDRDFVKTLSFQPITSVYEITNLEDEIIIIDNEIIQVKSLTQSNETLYLFNSNGSLISAFEYNVEFSTKDLSDGIYFIKYGKSIKIILISK